MPRIEVHTITEGERLDKDGALRQFSFTVESIGNASLAATTGMNEKNIELQDLTETADTSKIIYRLLQGFTAWVERVKEDVEPQEETTEESTQNQE